MTHWMCTGCGYYFQGNAPLDKCPSCSQVCAFNDATCCRPERGGERNLDPLLIGATLGTLKSTKIPETQPTTRQIYVESIPIADIMNGLNEKQIQKVRSLGHVESYDNNAVICTEGEEARKLYLVEEGEVAVQSELGRGVHIPITVVSAGQAFGWSTLVPPYKLMATVTASSKTKILSIERESLLKLMKTDPILGSTLMQNITSTVASRLRNLELELVGLVQRTR